MTRETKVGLVVGTGIILLIGIVVSDHLASQQRGQQQTSAPPGYTDLTSGQPRTINPQGVRPLVDAAKERDNRNVTPLPPAGHDDRQGNGRRTDPVGIIRYGPDGRVLPPDAAAPGPGNTANNTADAGDSNLANLNRGTPGTPAPGTPGPGNGGLASNNGSTGTPLPRGLTEELRNNGLLPDDPTPRIPTEPLIHHVQPGESLWAIAEKYYGVGNGRYSAEIARANHEMLMADGGVRVGVRLVIPNRTITTPGSSVNGVADRNAPGTVPGVTPRDVIPPTTGDNGAARPALKTVKVEPGDSLSAIATRSLGSIKYMQLIIDANKNLIHDADDIKAGMTLVIPEPPATVVPPAPAPRTPGTVTPPTTPPVTPPAVASNAKVHKVQPRDTFSSIARARLGNERRWKEIYDLNKRQVADPDALREGIVLVLPSDAR